MTEWWLEFHWQRPWWLLGIGVSILVGFYLLRGQAQSNSWKQVINADLLPHLLQGAISRQQRWPIVSLSLAGIIASLAMAGPSWEKLPQPVHKTESALVILLDLSPSMMAEDIKPSRLIRARLKLIDLLKQRQEGLTALIAYAGEAYTVTPLTDDTDTIISLLPSLSPAVMPLGGSNTEMAVEQAVTLFKDAGLLQGDILLVTDGVTEEAADTVKSDLPAMFRLSVLGVGSDDGAPIPIQNGGFAKDRSGSIVLAKLNSGELRNLASYGGGRYRTLSSSDADIEDLISQPELLSEQTRKLEREFDTWIDRGAWLCVLLLPFAAFAFRRGWLLALPLILIQPEPAYALGWQDLWQTKDQQAQELLEQDQAAAAAETFERSDWKAAAQYRAGNYEAAVEGYSEDPSAEGHYNRGNALARSGKLQEALEAYDEALTQNPDMEDAAANKQLVEELLEQQKQQQEQQQDNQGDSSDQQQNNDQQQQNQDQQSGDDSQSQSDSSEQDSQSQEQSDSSSEQQPSDNQNQQESEQNQSESSDQSSSEDQQSSEQEQSSEQQAQQNPEEGDGEPQNGQQPVGAQETELSEEEQQAMEQWLRKIPDDPSGLMRRKFEHQYRQRRKEYQQGTWQPPENEANKRW